MIPFAAMNPWRVRLVLCLALGAMTTMLLLSVSAVPYASRVINNAGTISFILNEAADNVTVALNGGASTLDLGALPAGPHSFNLGGASTFAIVVSKSASSQWTLI